MSSNVGLSTPRGSGTSGYVQRNFAFMKPRNAGYGAPYPPVSGSNSSSSFSDPASKPFKQRQPDKQILEHDRRRAIEVKVMEERERLEEENERIEEEMKDKKKGGKGGDEKERRQFKSYQVHELAEAKIEESERLRKALGIKEEK
ncbi:hypothetical protein ASPBRDRAFT_183684 [Aspergillus brasiliensis CBS 101740]|uniref:CWF21 domain-containing protein n=1 Tax=Aspergillus brasiliensis (strain CBS 101740 / IMI 381727 / IBT 21946) TaxID=767769 RepID=A0A1L9UBR9_ASPBC|nr:hypothetical protein ASPBRDRAFT_183684 [Aspergillus brasiliensis CBS 101740]